MSTRTTTVVPRRAARTPPPRRRRRALRALVRWAVLLTIPVLGILAGLLFGLVYKFSKVPPPQDVRANQTIILYDVSGKRELARIVPGENREEIPTSQLPKMPLVRNAVLAAEDKNFYHHGALSYRGLLRAAWANVVQGRVAQGGSTITQQYVRNAYKDVGRQRTLFRKVREAITAIKLEQEKPKDEILADYLNTIYFGRGAYGIEAATHTFFNNGRPRSTIEPQQLTPAQAALLAGSIRSPQFYAKKKNQRFLKARRDTVLSTMLEMGTITEQQYRQALATPVTWHLNDPDQAKTVSFANASNGEAYFIEKVREYLYDKYPEWVVNTGGLRVYTTLDPTLQRYAVEAVEGTLGPKDPAAALVAIDPRTGFVKAMYGGRDFRKRPFNYAIDTSHTRQAGSTMKPFVLEAALASGKFTLGSRFDAPAKLPVGRSTVSNFDVRDHGNVDLLEATRESINTVYMQLVQAVEPVNVAGFGRKSGLTETITKNEDPAHFGNPVPPSIALGANTVNTLQLASAYGTWANDGDHVPATIIAKITYPNGRLLEDHTHQLGTRVVSTDVARTINFALQHVVEEGTGTRARLFVGGHHLEVAGKTGTTNDFKDARFVGYRPDMVVSVWMGWDTKPVKPMRGVAGVGGGVAGGSFPAKIWHNFMMNAIPGVGLSTDATFPQPDAQQLASMEPSTTAPPTTVTPDTAPVTTGFPQPTFPPNGPGTTVPDATFPFTPTTHGRRQPPTTLP